MIVFRCLSCSLENISTDVLKCPRCGRENFLVEYRTSLKHGPRLQPTTKTTHSSVKPTIEGNFEVKGNRASLNQYNESTGKCFSFSYEDSTNGIGRTDVVRRDSEGADPINFYTSTIRFGQEQVSRNFSQDLIVRKGMLPEIHNIFILTYSLNALDNDTFNPLRYNFLPDPVFVSTAERKHQINFSDPRPTTECKSRSFAEMMIERQKTVESPLIQIGQGQMGFSGPSHFEPHTSMLQSYSESAIAKSKLKGTEDSENNSSPDFLTKLGNSSNRNIMSEDTENVKEVAQQEAHASNQQTRKEGPENACVMFPKDSSTSNKALRCQRCPRWFRSESAFNVHVRNNCAPNTYKCDKCPLKFSFESQLKRHQLVHTVEKFFKCDQCDYACKRKQSLKLHIDRYHRK